ncbi:MAG: hypothetical protein Q7J16_04100 [Candidatus Cloacimonadales bacterium]|nr:hypothetical protein [Candidatus Cloacimonadales bacterium]
MCRKFYDILIHFNNIDLDYPNFSEDAWKVLNQKTCQDSKTRQV